MNFRLYPILIDLFISQIYDWILLVIQRSFNGIFRFIGAFVHHSHTSYVWLKISTVSESTLVTNTNALPNFNLRAVLKLINELHKEVFKLCYLNKEVIHIPTVYFSFLEIVSLVRVSLICLLSLTRLGNMLL